jgi:hypothetical protein
MQTNNTIEQFYEDVKILNLNKPLTTIVRQTGFNKGSVSSYLNRKETPSQNFLQAFYKKFGKSLDDAKRGTSDALHLANKLQDTAATLKGDDLLKALLVIAESNRVLAYAQDKSNETALVIARSNETLSKEFTAARKTTGDSDSKMLKESVFLLLALRDEMAEIAAKVKKTSTDVEREVLRKRATAHQRSLEKMGSSGS